MSKLVIGLDFGTLSARALLVDAQNGAELASVVKEYDHGVLDRTLPDGTPLKPDSALQHPGDWLDCIDFLIPEVVKRAGANPDDVAGIGLDFTSSTVLPVLSDGTPLCLTEGWTNRPCAWPMLWKHHAGQPHARRIEAVAIQRNERFLARYGGRVSSEWMLPKVWQAVEDMPEIMDAGVHFLEAGDWLVERLTGAAVRSESMAGYKIFYHPADGFLSEDFLNALDPRLTRMLAENRAWRYAPVGACAGRLTAAMAERYGLPRAAVAVSNTDALAAVPAAGAVRDGDLLMILGTSGCHLLQSRRETAVPGICGAVPGGMMPGWIGYEAGQNCCGDHFQWFVENCCPGEIRREAEARGMGVHALLTERASRLRPGESGLVALDWWNGNRSVLVDADLTGLIAGCTLQTRPEEIYRALIEATAYGARKIVENFEEHGVPVGRICASGGIVRKNPMMMQIYADVLHREIRVLRSSQASALGSAIFAAVAAGIWPDANEAAGAMGGLDEALTFTPAPERERVYDALYREYLALHDLFGRGGLDTMKRLKAIRADALR